MLPPLAAEKLQNFFGVFLQFQIGVDRKKRESPRGWSKVVLKAALKAVLK